MFETILPPELEDIIYRNLHRLYIQDVCKEITTCIVWVRCKDGQNAIGLLLSGQFQKESVFFA
eukprot:m.355122 g.355122  ORF g.355122 m.355122 type:complete len:63 (+) comp77100_c0_seq1:133-321(+)